MIFQRTRPESCLSDLALDQKLSGDIAPESEGAADAHLAECPQCRARLEDHRETHRRLLAVLPPLPSGLTTELASHPTSLHSRRLQRWVPIALAAGLAAAFSFYGLSRPDVDRVTLKGGPALGFYVKHGTEVRLGQSGEVVAPGDALRFIYSTERALHLAILGLDASGRVSRYHPPPGMTTRPESVGRDRPLESAALLDETLGREEILGWFCEQPIDLDRLEASLRARLDEATESPGCTRVRLAIEKHR